MKQNIEAAISMRPIARPESKKNPAMRIVGLLASLAKQNRACHSEWSNEQSGLHERDQSAFRRQLLEARLRETHRRVR